MTESGHAISIFTSNQFTNSDTTLTLKHKNGRVVAVDKTAMLGEVEETVETFTESKSKNAVSLKPDLESRDMMSYIELNEIEAGDYTLKIGVPIAFFLKSSKFDTCLDFDLVVEYVSRQKTADEGEDDEDLPLQMIGISPVGAKDLTLNDKLSLQVIFDKQVDSRSLASGESELTRVCTLQYLKDKDLTLTPEQTFFSQNFATLTFNFNEHAGVLKNAFNNIDSEEVCFNLICQTEPGKDLQEIIPIADMSQYKYCLTTRQKPSSIKMCNGYAKPKFEEGQCICTFPYSGETCDRCEEGFEAKRVEIN